MASTADELSCSATDELLVRARTGDAEAFCRLAEQYESQLFRKAYGMAGRQDIAEDIAAETLVEAWRSIARYDGSCKFSTWLFSILLHRYQKHARHAKSRPISMSALTAGESQVHEQSQENLAGAAPSPSQDLIQKEARDRLRSVLDQMPAKYREVLLMRFFEDASLGEIAAALSCPVGTVKSRLHYALEELRKTKPDLNLD